MTAAAELSLTRWLPDRAALTPMIAELPFTLLRHELLMRMAPAADDTIVAIVDEVFIPLATRGAAAG